MDWYESTAEPQTLQLRSADGSISTGRMSSFHAPAHHCLAGHISSDAEQKGKMEYISNFLLCSEHQPKYSAQNVSSDGCRVAQMFPRMTSHTFVFIFQNTKRCFVSALETLDREQILLIHKCLFQLLAFISLWRVLARSINRACLWIHGSVCHHWSRSRMPFTLMLIFMPSVHFLLNSCYCVFGLNVASHNQSTHALSFL